MVKDYVVIVIYIGGVLNVYSDIANILTTVINPDTRHLKKIVFILFSGPRYNLIKK